MAGRFAPSPTGPLHVGNLRTALIAWLAARGSQRRFLVRMEDLDRVTSSEALAQCQLADLAAIGLDWDGPVLRQSERFELYRAAIDQLASQDLVYPCYCTRREIRREIEAASSAPHGLSPEGAYPGTCRELTNRQRAAREASGRRPALRLRTDHRLVTVHDMVAGTVTGRLDDVVLARADGVPAYNLAVVVDDAVQGVTQVVRGDDLLSSTPRQVHLQQLLGYDTPEYVHVPMVIGSSGRRLAKRDGAITLTELVGPPDGDRDSDGSRRRLAGLVRVLIGTLGEVGLEPGGQGEPIDLAAVAARFDPARLPRWPVTLEDLRAALS